MTEIVIYKRGAREVPVRADARGTQRILERAGYVRVEPQEEVIQVSAWPAFLTDAVVQALRAHDIMSLEDARRIADADLLAVPGVGPATVRKIREALG